MSGRSGYGRSRIVGKLIHLPANMMMAGLAPKVGKSGASIRLYYQRVDECLCNGKCISEPITLIKRYLTAGKWGANTVYGNDSAGDIVIPALVGNAATDAATLATTGTGNVGGGARAPYYILIFDKIVTSPFAPAANQAVVDLQIFKGDVTVGPSFGDTLFIPASDYRYITWSGAGTALGISTEQFNTLQPTPQAPSSGWTINIDGVFGDDTVGASKWHPINCLNASSEVNIPPLTPVAFPTAGGWVNDTGAPGVPPGHYSKFGPNIAYIVDKNIPTHFPGAPNGKSAIIFHIGDLLIQSWQNNSLPNTSIRFGPVSPYEELMLLVDATTNPASQPPRTKNNISTSYKTPSGLIKGATINTEDDCFGETVTAPISSFNIPSGNGTPVLEPLPM